MLPRTLLLLFALTPACASSPTDTSADALRRSGSPGRLHLLLRSEIVDQDGDGVGDDQLGGVLGALVPAARREGCAFTAAGEFRTLELTLVPGLPVVPLPLARMRLERDPNDVEGGLLVGAVERGEVVATVLPALAEVVAAIAAGFDGPARADEMLALFDRWAPPPLGGDGVVQAGEVVGQAFVRALLAGDLHAGDLVSFEARFGDGS